ncbi:MAG: DUF502 domain-containing protein [Thermoguttaceae bacterium]|jgi:uncharacterized membrane protein
MNDGQHLPQPSHNRGRAAFRRAVFRGLGVFLPPLLTVLILIWVISTTKSYIIEPLMYAAREGLVWATADIHDGFPQAKPTDQKVNVNGYVYRQLHNGTFIPELVYDRVKQSFGSDVMPAGGEDIYRRYVELTVLRPYYAIPLFLAIFVLLLYLLGKFITVDVGGYFMNLLESGIRRLPLVRNVYSAAKQISDFIFADREFEFTRIVAVEFPRKGTWQLGFVTGEGLAEVRTAVPEPLLTVLIPYSPLPITGCTIIVRKSECIDLNITFDQACEYIVSCGVVVPSMRLGQMRSTPALPENNS